MARQQQNRGNTANKGNQIPRRVENAAQSMVNQPFSGPRRGYIPPETDRVQPFQGSGYYGQNPQQYYPGQSPVTGSQRGFVLNSAPVSKPSKKKKTGLITFLVIFLLAALGTGGYFAASSYLKNKEISEKVDPYEALFCPGVYVDGIHLGGMTPTEALEAVEARIRQRHDAWKVQLIYNGEQIPRYL